MRLYAESSAVLSWLLQERDAGAVREALEGADLVIASDLTLVECDRALTRAHLSGRMPEVQAARRRILLEGIASHWVLLRLSREVVERARHRLPGEPLRTLDALHVASALNARSVVPGLGFLSLDHRVRASAQELGFAVFPAVA